MFKLKERGTTVKREILAGLITFFSMSYVLIVNPSILADAGMDEGALFTATALSAVVGTLIMALYANFPVALASGMGLNAFFSYSVVIGLGYTWQEALFGVFCSGIIFMLLSVSGLRQRVINSIPNSLKYATSAGIGFFIAFIGLQNSGIIVKNDATLVTMGNLLSVDTILTVVGVAIILFFIARKNNFALIIGMGGIFIVALILSLLGVPTSQIVPTSIISLPPSIKPIFGGIFTVDYLKLLTDLRFIVVIFSFLFVDFFNTTGTLIAVGSEAELINEDGELQNAGRALMSDGVATTVGAVLGTTSVTVYVESLSGIKAGGRTGLTTVSVAFFFLLSLFFSPVLTSVAGFVTAPILITVGILMAGNKEKIDYQDFASVASAFILILFMIVSYSIATGIAAGFLVYTFVKLCEGKYRDIPLTLYFLDIIFLIYFGTTAL